MSKASAFYEAIEASGGFYATPCAPADRSRMNAPFNVSGGDDAATDAFLLQAYEHNLVGFRTKTPFGRSQWLRASFYTGTTLEQVEQLVGFMAAFAAEWATRREATGADTAAAGTKAAAGGTTEATAAEKATAATKAATAPTAATSAAATAEAAPALAVPAPATKENVAPPPPKLPRATPPLFGAPPAPRTGQLAGLIPLSMSLDSGLPRLQQLALPTSAVA